MDRSDRWQHLVQGAFALSEGNGSAQGPDSALRLIDSVLEVFPDAIDPVDDFEGYAVRRLALALRTSLES